MNEGAVTMTPDGTILYCNHRFADLATVPLEKVMGISLLDFVAEGSRQAVSALLSEAGLESRAIESSLIVQGGNVVPVNISVNTLKTKDLEAVCAVFTDLSELMLMRRLEDANERLSRTNEELQNSERMLRDSRRATLNLLEDTTTARKKADETNVRLQIEATERKQAEEKLSESEERYRSIFEGANDGILACDITIGKFLFVNKRMSALIGYSTEEILKLGVKDIHPPKDLPYVLNEFNEMAADKKTETRAVPVLRKDGGIIYCDIGSSFLGKTILIGFFRDVTERKLAEEALQKAKDELEFRVRERTAELARLTRLYSVLSKVNEAIVRIHEPLKLFEEICRIAVKEGAFRLAWIGLLDPDTRAVIPVASHGETAYLNGIRIIASDVPEGKGPTGRAVVEQRHFICSDIENDPIMLPWRDRALSHGIRSSSAFPIIHSGEAIGAFTIYSDKPSYFTQEEINLLLTLTENISFAIESIENEKRRREAEEALRMLNEELEKKVAERTADLEAVNKELEAYSYTISHDLRAPLRSIEGFSRAIMEDYADKLEATGRDYFLRVTSASHRMMQLIDALLTMSRLTQSEIKEKVVNLSNAVNVIAHELKQSQPERAVEFVIAERVSANGDPDMLRIVLENLLNNAWKFTSRHPSARIEFGVNRIDDKDVYFVRDDGAGFNMEFAGNLFNPFRRFHTEADFSGLGIGLATVHKIITKHGGKIWAESAPEKGATFYFTLG